MTQTAPSLEPQIKWLRYSILSTEELKHQTPDDRPSDDVLPFDSLDATLTDLYQKHWMIISNVLYGTVGVIVLYRSPETVPGYKMRELMEKLQGSKGGDVFVDPNKSTKWPD